MASKSSTITNDRLAPIHPGEVLEQEFLIPMALSAYRVAVDIGVPPPRINDIVLRKRAITADTALRLARYFGTSERFWMGLQSDYDLDVERDRLAAVLEAVPRFDRVNAPSIRRPRETVRSGGDAKLLGALHAALADKKKVATRTVRRPTVVGARTEIRSVHTGRYGSSSASRRPMTSSRRTAKKK